MAITYFEKERIFKLDTPGSSYVIGIVDKENFVGHVYYGKKLRDANIAYLLRTGEGPFVPSENNRERVSFYDTFPMEYAGNGLGDYRRSSISVRTEGGHTAVSLFYVSHKIYAGKPGLAGLPATFGDEDSCETLELLCEDPVLGLKVTLLYTAFSDVDVITRSVRIENDGEMLYLTKALSFSMDMDNRDFTLLTMHGSWARERMLEHRKVKKGFMGVESVRGESSHQEHPFMALAAGNADQSQGEVYGMHFVYSGNFIGQVELGQFDTVRVGMGIHPENFCWKLEKGESFQTPEVVLVYSDTGYDGMTHQFHELYRNHLIRSEYKDKKRPILINNWEATYFDFNEDKLVNIMDEAVALGVDMFLLDDGWFANKYPRSSDHQGLGDWEETVTKLPNGIGKLVKEATDRGIKFGLWIEPEMVNPKSELSEKHKDWVIHLPNRDEYYFRNQMVLDLTNPKVQDYVYGVVDNLMTKYPGIAYFKWDCNSPITNIYSPYLKDQQSHLYIEYVRGLYNVLERIKQKYPNLPMMLCSGGGGRCDYEALKYFTEFWCSDNTDPVERAYIQWGFSQFFPAKAMCAHVTSWNKNTSIKFRTDMASMCKLGFDIGLKEMAAEELEYCQLAVANWKRLQPVILDGVQYRLVSPYESNHMAVNYVSQDASKGVIFAYDIYPRFQEKLIPLKVKGLDPNKMYRVKEINLMPGTESTLEADGELFSGDYLMKVGLDVFGFRPTQSHVIELTAE